MTRVDVDVALFGGGIAGLWTLHRLRSTGYRALLFETDRLGGVQSIASQGIIHGGAKYALAGRLTGSSEAIRDMPRIWGACLDGTGEIDLTRVDIRARHQLLWTQPQFGARVAGWFSSRIMRSRMIRLDRDDLPPPFDRRGFGGDLYRLEEPVLNTASLMAELAAQAGTACYRYPAEALRPEDADLPGAFSIGDLRVNARRIALTAGAGNATLLARWGRSRPAMQRRPLQMVMARGDLPPINGHWLGASRQLLLTITSAPAATGEIVWYLGGGLSESGVGRSPAEQISAARAAVAAALPWLRLPPLRWKTLAIDRAEPRTADGSRPAEPMVDADRGIYTCWPTKLAFAPRVAELVLAQLARDGIRPSDRRDEIQPALELPRPELACYPWEAAGQWS